MHILVLADEPVQRLWGGFGKDTLKAADLILSAGDLPAAYLSYMTCFSSAPVVYIHGNHDEHYEQKAPDGCICAEGHVIMVKGVRILGLGGSFRYKPGCPTMFSEREMAARIRGLRLELFRSRGFDILLTHAPVAGLGDEPDLPHRGFECFKPLLSRYRPAVMFHGHIHRAYNAMGFQRVREWDGIPVINACDSYEFDLPDDVLSREPRPSFLARRAMEKRAEPSNEHF